MTLSSCKNVPLNLGFPAARLGPAASATPATEAAPSLVATPDTPTTVIPTTVTPTTVSPTQAFRPHSPIATLTRSTPNVLNAPIALTPRSICVPPTLPRPLATTLNTLNRPSPLNEWMNHQVQHRTGVPGHVLPLKRVDEPLHHLSRLLRTLSPLVPSHIHL